MSEELQETRTQEIARVRSYLASQAMRRTIPQITESVQQAHQQFLTAVSTVPAAFMAATPRVGEWSALDVLLHVRTVAALELSGLTRVLVDGVKPPDIHDALVTAPAETTCEALLAELEDLRARQLALALSADPDSHLQITWGHSEFGQMHWREWLLFSRVHILDHARQIQAIVAMLAQEEGEAGS
ncbi:MAG TPA: DinB family protein [Ktedonobacteraceae bacterium]|nr:DinB family protein [Ktedonobacteraceae bacterium]